MIKIGRMFLTITGDGLLGLMKVSFFVIAFAIDKGLSATWII
jgi:hypothetical protein